MRHVLRRMLLLGMGVVVGAAAMEAYGQSRELTDAQKKLLAQRAARVDAMRKLAEQIKGLRITSSTYVKDFVAEDDRIETELRAFLRGAREAGPPRYYSDGVCDLDMEVTMEWVVTTLKELHTRHYKGDRIKATDFEQMTQRNERQVIKVTGSGAPPSDEIEIDDADSYGDFGAPATRAVPFGWENVMPQGRLMARRAAEVDAMRKLAERIKGLQITSTTFVRDFVAEDDRINTELNTFIRGVRKGEPRYEPDQICSVECEVTLEQVISTLKELHTRHYKGDRIRATDFEQMTQRVETKVIKETGNGVPPAQYIKQPPPVPPAPDLPDWVTERVQAVGNGVPPADMQGTAQGRLMAARAAELDAKRKLAEELNGFFITSDTTVRDFVAQHDEIRTDLDTFIQGASVVSTEYDEEDTATVTVEIPLQRLWEIVSIRMELRRG
ncbi:MAG: hypothetical protein JSU68_02060 [Phycisphaerales bacterium]|nr:MAG: hypothetical protein JSU68_02060 [Phycisphaerales bacterium]